MNDSVDQSSSPGALDGKRIDAVMDRASEMLVKTRYFEAVQLCDRGLRLALAARDWGRLARIALPLQEARRQIRQQAVDEGKVRIVDTPTQLRTKPLPGCYLIQPPLVGADARAFRLAAERKQVPVFVLAREPLTRSGEWPVVGVSTLTVRARVSPPPGVAAADTTPTRDRMEGAVPMAWFEAAAEELGDAGIASVDPAEPPAHRVEDLLERLDAVPEHEKLHQRLADAAREAETAPPPHAPRRRGMDHPYSF